MWYWQYLRAQELARERIAEAEDWRRARLGTRRAGSKPRRPSTTRDYLRALDPRFESR